MFINVNEYPKNKLSKSKYWKKFGNNKKCLSDDQIKICGSKMLLRNKK